jgi:radical SAM superfamily enzyme YgiQ (UPF0313 family)
MKNINKKTSEVQAGKKDLSQKSLIKNLLEEKEILKEKKDILFFWSPVHSWDINTKHIISLWQTQWEIPNWLNHIASYLKKHEISSIIIPMDSFIMNETKEEDFYKKIEKILARQIDLHNPNMLCFELMYTFNSDIVINMTKRAKEKYPEKPIVVWWNHATFSSYGLLDTNSKTWIDIIIHGEGEWTTEELYKAFKDNSKPDLSNIPWISYRNDNWDIVRNKPRQRWDIKEIPPLDFNIIKLPEGIDISMFNHSVMYTRACKGNCAFCTSPKMWNRIISQKKISNFRKEIEFLINNNVKNISLRDDDILVDKKSFKEIMNILW